MPLESSHIFRHRHISTDELQSQIVEISRIKLQALTILVGTHLLPSQNYIGYFIIIDHSQIIHTGVPQANVRERQEDVETAFCGQGHGTVEIGKIPGSR